MTSANQIFLIKLKEQHQKAHNELIFKHVVGMQTLQQKHKEELESLTTLQQRESDEQAVKQLEELRSYDKMFTCKETNLQRLGPLNAWMQSRTLNKQSETCSSETKEKIKCKNVKTFRKKASLKSQIRMKLNQIKKSLIIAQIESDKKGTLENCKKIDLIENTLDIDIIMSQE